MSLLLAGWKPHIETKVKYDSYLCVILTFVIYHTCINSLQNMGDEVNWLVG
jgi:hypothetical protein